MPQRKVNETVVEDADGRMAAAAGDGDAALKVRSAVQAAAQGSCAWPGCADDGAFRAPRSRRRADGFYMFCLSHVRDYNAAWDFFAGMTPEQIAAYRHEDVTWHRPTRRFSGRGGAGSGPGGGSGGGSGSNWGGGEWGDEIRMRDELGIFAAAFGADGGIDGIDPRAAERPMKPGEGAALKVFGLDQNATLNDIKARYKELAKRYHPDATGGDKRSEDRFKAVNKAYRYLLACGYA